MSDLEIILIELDKLKKELYGALEKLEKEIEDIKYRYVMRDDLEDD